jgi:carbonic anhydrase
VTIIRNAGALLTTDSLRSILIAIYELNVNKIIVCGHTDCGGQMNYQDMENFVNNISEQTNLSYKDVLANLKSNTASEAVLGFVDVEKQVRETVQKIRNHPLIVPLGIQVSGFLYSTQSGDFRKLS